MVSSVGTKREGDETARGRNDHKTLALPTRNRQFKTNKQCSMSITSMYIARHGLVQIRLSRGGKYGV